MDFNKTLIAEIGGNHEGDFGLAKEILFSALETEVEVVKFQIYTGDSLVNKLVSPSRNQHFKKFELKVDQYHELAEITESNGKRFNASIWDLDLFYEFERYLNFIKIGSGDFTNYYLLEKLSESNLPMILSTGLCTFEEIKKTVNHLRQQNEFYRKIKNLSLLQCTSMYPIPYREANLNVLNSLKTLGVTVGYSDHTEDLEALTLAYSMGAKILEFHFTLEKLKSREFRDHKVSLTQKDVNSLCSRIETINLLKGDLIKNPTESEISNGHLKSFRRGVFLNNGKEIGDTITFQDLTFLRPEEGIAASEYHNIIGKKCLVAINALEPLKFCYFE